jgi:hypothetical protein
MTHLLSILRVVSVARPICLFPALFIRSDYVCLKRKVPPFRVNAR